MSALGREPPQLGAERSQELWQVNRLGGPRGTRDRGNGWAAARRYLNRHGEACYLRGKSRRGTKV